LHGVAARQHASLPRPGQGRAQPASVLPRPRAERRGHGRRDDVRAPRRGPAHRRRTAGPPRGHSWKVKPGPRARLRDQGEWGMSPGVWLDGVRPPVSLMTCSITPTPPSETVRMSWNWTPEVFGASKAWSATTAGLTLK